MAAYLFQANAATFFDGMRVSTDMGWWMRAVAGGTWAAGGQDGEWAVGSSQVELSNGLPDGISTNGRFKLKGWV